MFPLDSSDVSSAEESDPHPPAAADRRLYVPRGDRWAVRLKPGFDREYCHAKMPGDPHYHLLMGGEIHLDNGEQKYCLNCGLRLGLVTFDRLFWQSGRAETVMPPDPDAEPLV